MEALFPAKFLKSLTNEKVLVVGVGGIGCEVLKQMLLWPIKNIEIVGSGLSRQTLTPSKSAISADSSISDKNM